ncbi:Signal transduction histidine kinase [Lentzea jiangxiensis]|uniref:histidine kinase n=1 Tax=Lentzea jiangxiensis TaxID=641025 RepID=A0A1H0WT05_9PSEU|nr:Signal transduction histidine kinase [Lentzea jiangxiensis]
MRGGPSAYDRRVTTERRWASRLPPAVWDALLPALLLLHVLTTWPPAELPVAAALTAALALPLLWRRRAPLAVFGVVATAALVQWLVDVQLPADVALLVALHTVAAKSGRRVTLVAATVVEIGAVLACLRWASEGAFLAPFAALTAMVVAAAVLGVNDRATRAYLEAVRGRAVAEERARITREMHDIVTHNLSVMVALTDAAVHAQHRSPAKATAAMLQVAETGRQALTDMRRSLGVLRTGEPDAARHPLPGIAQLETLAAQMRTAGLPTTLDIDGGYTHIPATAQLTVYRLVQEALTNTLKHTPTGTRAEVRIECAAETVTVAVTDTGPPASPVASSGHGITGMRERSAGYGGTVLAGPLPGGGWGVHTRLVFGGAEASA